MQTQRISLSPTGLEVLLALSQAPQGARMARVANALEVAPATVEAALRVMVGYGIVARMATGHRYVLRDDHPALTELIALAARMSEPRRAIDIVLRANDAVAFACRDDDGYIVSLARDDPVDPRDAGQMLEIVLPRIALGRPDVPSIQQFPADEFTRLLRVVPSLRMRVAGATQLKGEQPSRASARRSHRSGRTPSRTVVPVRDVTDPVQP